jgi:hypothetical protein
MTGSEVATTEGGNLPALRFDGGTTLTAEDLALPRLYVAQAITNAVQDGNVTAGALFVAQDSDDPDPVTLAEKGSDEGVLIHVLALRKGKSLSVDGSLETWRYDDPNAPSDAWTTYTYAIAIPEYDSEIPCRWLLTRTGRPAAQKLNTVLARLSGQKPPYSVAFRVTTVERSNDRGRYFIPRVAPTEATDENVEIAGRLYAQIGDSFAGSSSNQQAATADPAI